MNLSYRYANAFLNVYNDRLNFDTIKRIEQAIAFLYEHQQILLLLQLPVIKQSVKEQWLVTFCKQFGLVDLFKKTMLLLLQHKRGYLLPAVLQAIIDCYRQRHNIQNIVIKSSVPLPEKYHHDIEHFIQQHMSGVHQYHYQVDASLIAGIRIQSDTMLWECSINKRLRDIAHANGCEELWKKIQI